MKRLSDVLYQIRHSKTSKPVIIHADNLKPYRGNIQHPATPTEYTSDQTVSARVPKRGVPARIKRLKLPADTRHSFDQQDQSLADSQSEARIKTIRHGRVIKRPVRFRDSYYPNDL